MSLDHIDTSILSVLADNARASQVELAEQIGLSSTAIARRQKALEEAGLIRGYWRRAHGCADQPCKRE